MRRKKYTKTLKPTNLVLVMDLPGAFFTKFLITKCINCLQKKEKIPEDFGLHFWLLYFFLLSCGFILYVFVVLHSIVFATTAKFFPLMIWKTPPEKNVSCVKPRASYKCETFTVSCMRNITVAKKKLINSKVYN